VATTGIEARQILADMREATERELWRSRGQAGQFGAQLKATSVYRYFRLTKEKYPTLVLEISFSCASAAIDHCHLHPRSFVWGHSEGQALVHLSSARHKPPSFAPCWLCLSSYDRPVQLQIIRMRDSQYIARVLCYKG